MATIGDTTTERADHLAAACLETLKGRLPESVQAVFLYGSALGPLFRPDSDIDIAVLDKPEKPLTWREQASLMDDLERSTRHNVDLRMLRESSLSHQADVLENGRLLWSQDPCEVERYSRTVLKRAKKMRKQSERDWPQILERLAGLGTPRR